MNPLAYFACCAKINNRRLNQLAAYFFSLDQVLKASYKELINAGMNEEVISTFIKWRTNNPPDKIAEKLSRDQIWTVVLGDENYPSLLEQITDPPQVLFVRGKLAERNFVHLSVVGTRRLTAYGRLACEKLVNPLVQNNVVIVSGLALGLDAVAHETTLKAGGITIAVLGGGIDKNTVAPHSNQNLSEKIIASGGAIISEYPPNYPPDTYTFPARNRIIAGLSKGTLVVEAPSSSGALITANCALDYNREVMAVPHQINAPMGKGCNMLIKKGAQAITEPEEILETLGILVLKQKELKSENNLSQMEQKIILTLDNEPKHIDTIIQLTKLNSSEVASAAAMLEIKNQIKNIGGARYIKVY